MAWRHGWMVGALAVMAVASGVGCKSARAGHSAALAKAGACSLITAELGTPLDGSWSSFNQQGTGSGKQLRSHGSIEGPKGSGAIEYEALGDGTTWAITEGTVAVNGKLFDLMTCAPK